MNQLNDDQRSEYREAGTRSEERSERGQGFHPGNPGFHEAPPRHSEPGAPEQYGQEHYLRDRAGQGPYGHEHYGRDQYGREHSSEQLFDRRPFGNREDTHYYGTGSPGWGGPGFTGGVYAYGDSSRFERRPLEAEYSGPREFAVRLVRPSGSEQEARLTLEHLFQTPPPAEHRYACLLRGLGKAEVPLGTEIWTIS